MELKTHFNAKELAQLALTCLPTSDRRILEKAKRENWQFQKRKGRGGGVEYAFNSLPPEIQHEILLKTTPQQTAVEVQKIEQTRPLASNELWQMWDEASVKAQEKAKAKLGAMFAVANLVETGTHLMQAIEMVAGKHNAELPDDERPLTVGSLKNWWYRVKAVPRQDWLPLMLCNSGKASKNVAEMSKDAWIFFKNLDLTREQRTFNHSYQILQETAALQGWVIPSPSSLKRRIEREVSQIEATYRRGGTYAVSRLYPSQVRTVAMLEAMEWINGDGYQHNVWVRFPDGEVKRPKSWIWQDVRTRKILAARTDKSENTDTIRLALLDVISRYGLPKHLTIDNTRAAANKKMTGGIKNRYRYTVKEDEVQGIIPALGIQLHWTSIQFGKGRGQAKPVERAFSHGGLGDYVDKHILLAGAYAGANAYEKPDYDGKNGSEQPVDYATFIMALEQGVSQWNRVDNRLSEICAGQMSYEQAFERDWAVAQKRPITQSQLRILLTLHEEATLQPDGTFKLNAGKIGSNKNRYECLDLIGSQHHKVVVRYDPADLHNKVWVYTLTGEYLGEATATEKVGFGDSQAGREYNRKMREWVRNQEKAIKARMAAEEMELSNYHPEVEFEERFMEVLSDFAKVPKTTTEPEIAEENLFDFNAVRKVETAVETEEISELEQAFQRGVSMLKKLK
ncbi:TPA: transposase domain-containing protein [Mannheimia haemolytica]